MSTAVAAPAAPLLLVGGESTGKSMLAAALTGRTAASGGFRGTTVTCERYRGALGTVVDTPGILLDADTEATRLALRALEGADPVVLVVNAGQLDRELADLLPLVASRPGAVVATFWDRVRGLPGAAETLASVERTLGVPVIPVDARRLAVEEAERVFAAARAGRPFPAAPPPVRTGWDIRPRRGFWDIPVLAPLLALVLLLLPAWVAVTSANRFADRLYPGVKEALQPTVDRLAALPKPLGAMLGGDYGVVSMGPFLLLYALPTVALFSLLLGLYKASGLVDRLTVAAHAWVRPFGLTGRDLVRVIIGFGCNVPAVINTRACSSCTRRACVSAISFGSACSYQLPSTLAVLSAAGMEHLALPYLLLLAGTTLVYIRLTTPRALREAAAALRLADRDFLQWPSPRAAGREALGMLRQFLTLALPVFLVICAVAALLQAAGLIDALGRAAGPLMALFNLPPDAAVAVLLGSVRKDGIAVGLLGADGALKVGLTTPGEVLTAVYLAGVMLPCLVTLFTVARELRPGFALRMAGRQALAAALFSALIAWSCRALGV